MYYSLSAADSATPPMKIVSLAPNMIDIMCVLGLEEKIFG